MKISDRIKAVIASDPEVRHRRAQLKAIGYICKHSAEPNSAWQRRDNGDVEINAWRTDKDNRLRQIGYLKLRPLSDFRVGTVTVKSLVEKFENMFKVELGEDKPSANWWERIGI